MQTAIAAEFFVDPTGMVERGRMSDKYRKLRVYCAKHTRPSRGGAGSKHALKKVVL